MMSLHKCILGRMLFRERVRLWIYRKLYNRYSRKMDRVSNVDKMCLYEDLMYKYDGKVYDFIQKMHDKYA